MTIFNAKLTVLNAIFIVFDTKLLVFNARFIVFDTKLLVLTAKFLICTHEITTSNNAWVWERCLAWTPHAILEEISV